MIDAAPDFFSSGIANRVTLKVPVRLICITSSQAAGSKASTGAVGPEMPALFTSTSKPPSEAMAAGTASSMSAPFDRSHTEVWTPGVALASAANASPSRSSTKTRAPAAAKAAAISRPMPDAPAVTRTRCACISISRWRSDLRARANGCAPAARGRHVVRKPDVTAWPLRARGAAQSRPVARTHGIPPCSCAGTPPWMRQ